MLANIPRELVPVWHKVKRQIKESPRRTRTESFLEWAAEHAGEVQRIVDADIDREVARLVAEERELRARDWPPRGLSLAELELERERFDMPPPVELGAVPF